MKTKTQNMDRLVETFDNINQSNSTKKLSYHWAVILDCIINLQVFLLLCPPPAGMCCSVPRSCNAGLWPAGGGQAQRVKPPSNRQPVCMLVWSAVSGLQMVQRWTSFTTSVSLSVTDSSTELEHIRPAAWTTAPQCLLFIHRSLSPGTESVPEVDLSLTGRLTQGGKQHRLRSCFTRGFFLKSVYTKRSITAVLVCRRDDDVHPDPHGHWIGGHQKEEAVVGLHTEGHAGPRRLSGRQTSDNVMTHDEE